MNSIAFATAPAPLKSTMHCANRSRGSPPIACSRRPCTWVEASTKLLRRRKPRAAGNTPSIRSFCSPSPRYSIPRGPQPENTRPGPIATFRTVRSSICWKDWKVRSSASLRGSRNAFWHAAFSLLRPSKAWTQTLSGAISEAESWIFGNSCFGRLGDTTRLRRKGSTSVLHRLLPEPESTGCAAITPPSGPGQVCATYRQHSTRVHGRGIPRPPPVQGAFWRTLPSLKG